MFGFGHSARPFLWGQSDGQAHHDTDELAAGELLKSSTALQWQHSQMPREPDAFMTNTQQIDEADCSVWTCSQPCAAIGGVSYAAVEAGAAAIG